MIDILAKFHPNTLSCYLVMFHLSDLPQTKIDAKRKIRSIQNDRKKIVFHPVGVGGVLVCQK